MHNLKIVTRWRPSESVRRDLERIRNPRTPQDHELARACRDVRRQLKRLCREASES